MEKEAIFVRTRKGEDEIRSTTAYLYGDIKRALFLVDGVSTFKEISKRAAPSLREVLGEMLKELEKGGFIQGTIKTGDIPKAAQGIAKAGNIPKMVVPLKMAMPLKKPVDNGFGELDFTAVFNAQTPETLAAEASTEDAKVRALAEVKAKQEAETARIKAEAKSRQDIEAARLRGQQEAEYRAREEAQAVRIKAEQEVAQARAELDVARAKAEAEAKARQEIEAARLKAQQEAEAARLRAEQVAAKAREDAERAKQQAAEAARAREETERRAKEEAQAARVKAEQEAAQARAELDAARSKAEAAHLKAEQEAAKAREEAEVAKQQAAAAAGAREAVERRAREETEANARQEIEAAKLKAQQEAEAARLKAEQVAAKAREEAELAKQQAADAARLREETERRAREEADATRVKAAQEAAQARAELEAARSKAEAARLKAEQEAAKAQEEAELAKQQAAAAARLREETERRAREEAEVARVKAEQAAAQARAELEAERAKTEAEARSRAEAEAKARQEIEAAGLKARQEAEAARLKAEQEAAKAREEAELARQQAEFEAQAREEAERRGEEMEAARATAEQEAAILLLQSARDAAQFDELEKDDAIRPRPASCPPVRSSSATVLFFDVVGYTRQPVNKQIEIKKQFNQLISDCLMAQGGGDRIILDTGDGAAIGFLQHPEDALEVAMRFRNRVTADRHQDYPNLNVRIGIHLGPINVVQDMNGQSNMVGDGINDAQRVMSFAGVDQIYISRPYYDYVSRLSDEYEDLFKYRGTQQDKHGREHSLYELVDAATSVEAVSPQDSDLAPAITLDPFSFAIPEDATAKPAEKLEEPETQQGVAALLGDIEKFNLPETPDLPEESQQAVVGEQAAADQPTPSISLPAESTAETATPAPAPTADTAKPAEMAHMPSAEEVTKLAETEAKIWSEAEQRARENAQKKSERVVQPAVAKELPVVQARRKPIPWGKLGAGLLALLLVALFAIPFVLPTREYATRIEQLLSARLKQPVHIGHLAGRLLPSPRLELSDVWIGEAKQFQAQQARVDFNPAAVFASVKAIDSVELDGVQANGAAVQQISAWLQQVAADTHYPVAHIRLNQGKLETDGIQLSGIGAEISFNQAGQFAQAKLRAEGNKFALEMNATPENNVRVSIAVHDGALPLLPNWVFDELNAKGVLTGDELAISSLEGRILDGALLGDARINWSSGWRAQGNLAVKAINMQNISKVLSGEMDGKAQFQMQSASFSELTETAAMNGSFAVRKGIISGIDLVEAVRLRSRESSPGGRTHFDELSGELSVANNVYVFRQLKIRSEVLAATGELNVAKRQLSGHISADLKMRAGMGPVALQVGGAVDNPSLHAVR